MRARFMYGLLGLCSAGCLVVDHDVPVTLIDTLDELEAAAIPYAAET